MTLPRRVCYKEGIVGILLDCQEDVLYLDLKHFNKWSDTEDKERLMRKWFALAVRKC